jgi:hypothetical protein
VRFLPCAQGEQPTVGQLSLKPHLACVRLQVRNVKVLCFEEMLADTKGHGIAQAAAFMGLELGEDLAERVLGLSSKEWMAENDDKFSEGWFYEEQLRNNRFDHPPLPPVAKVTKAVGGGDGSGGGALEDGCCAVPTEETKAWMQAQWTRLVFPKTGCENYDQMRAIVARESC